MGGDNIKQPFTIGDATKRKKKRSKKQEKGWAKRNIGGRERPASGAKWYAKGDVESGEGDYKFLWENKYTDKQSFRVTSKDWQKIKEEALKEGKIPGMAIQLRPQVTHEQEDLVVISAGDFEGILKELNKEEEKNE